MVNLNGPNTLKLPNCTTTSETLQGAEPLPPLMAHLLFLDPERRVEPVQLLPLRLRPLPGLRRRGDGRHQVRQDHQGD